MMFAISNAVYYGMSLIYTPIFTRLLTLEEMASVTLYSSWSNLLTMICTLSVWGCAYNGFVDFKGEEDSFLASMLLLSNASSALWVALFVLMPNTVSGLLGLSKPIVAFMAANLLLMPAYQLWCTKQRYAYRWRAMFAFAVVNALSTLVVGVSSVQRFPSFRAEAKIIGSGAVQLAIYAAMYVLILWRGFHSGTRPGAGKWPFALRICVPLLPGMIASSLLGQSDRIMIENLLGKAPTAIYGMAGNISTIAYTFVTSSINVSWVPFIFHKMEDGDKESLRRAATFVVGIVGLGCFAMALVTPEVLAVLAPQEYASARWCVPALLMGIFYEFVSWLFTNIESYFRRNEFITLVTIVSALVNIGLNWLLIPRFGFLAAAYTTWLSAILILVAHYFFFRRVCADAEINPDMYDLRRVGGLLVLFTAAAFLAMTLYGFFWIRAIILVFICGILAFNAKKILARLKALR